VELSAASTVDDGRRDGAARFPDGFLWGAATAASQIEGAVHQDGRGASIWDTFSHTPGRTFHGDTGDIADDHYNLLATDLRLMANLGLKAYRFSVAWPRIQPTGRGPANQRGLDFYRRVVHGLRELSITPVITLYHWDLPQALEDEGGWASRHVVDRFADYAGIIFDALGDQVPIWITLNEPWVSAWLGYGTGVHAPGIADAGKAWAATHHLLLAHGRAVQAMRARGRPEAAFGLSLSLSPVRPASAAEADVDAARRVDGHVNRLFLDPIFHGRYPQDTVALDRMTDLGVIGDGDLETIATPVDFLGVNYYSCQTVGAGTDGQADSNGHLAALGAVPIQAPGIQTTAMGWGIQPDGLSELLVTLARQYTKVPLYVTENGAAFHDYVDPEGGVDDVERIDFLTAHLNAAHRSLEAGVNLRGYFVWSLLDNFEWAHGYSKRFGLIFVDYATRRRTPKASFRWYREVIANNGLPGEVPTMTAPFVRSMEPS
jgi:beta-glucosidase